MIVMMSELLVVWWWKGMAFMEVVRLERTFPVGVLYACLV